MGRAEGSRNQFDNWGVDEGINSLHVSTVPGGESGGLKWLGLGCGRVSSAHSLFWTVDNAQ